MIEKLIQEEQRNAMVEDEDGYFGEEMDDDLRDGMLVFEFFFFFF